MAASSLSQHANEHVDADTLINICKGFGVNLKDEEQESYNEMLATFDESARELMAMPDYVPQVDMERFPRINVHEMPKEKNTHGAWAWRCSIKDARPNSGPLAGKTIVLKDMISVKDVPMLMGTEFVEGFVPDMDATVTTRVLEAGAHVLGKSVCENLCHSGTSHTAPTGIVENPFAKGYSAGGSSSGSGVLVALGEVDMSIGADQGGSVRIPAAHCGLVGFKPTFGLIPYTGCGSNEPTHDHLGPMTRTVLDNALLLQSIAGNDSIDDRSFPAPPPSDVPRHYNTLKAIDSPKRIPGLRIGIIKESLEFKVQDPRVTACFFNAVEGLRKAGATVSEVSIPLHAKAPAIWPFVSKVGGYLTKLNGASGHRSHNMLELNSLFLDAMYLQEKWDKIQAASKVIFMHGAWATQRYPLLLAKATNLGRQIRDAYDAALKDCDVLITPTLPYVATSHPNADASPAEQFRKTVGLTSNTCPFNQSGHPALTLPIGMLAPLEGPGVGKEDVKLPVGLQIVGRWWDEETVYRVAYAWESNHSWKKM